MKDDFDYISPEIPRKELGVVIPRAQYDALMALRDAVPIALGWEDARCEEIEAAFQAIRDSLAALRAAEVEMGDAP